VPGSGPFADVLGAHWWAAVAAVVRQVGDLEVAEDAVQDACVAALTQWPAAGMPGNPRAWLIGTARHKALDRLRRESQRRGKEAAAVRDAAPPAPADGPGGDDELGLIFACCHPALEPATRVGLTLRSVCGLTTAEIAAAFLVPEPTMAQRLVRAKRKIRQAGVAFRVPAPADQPARLSAVLRVVYLVFTAGHTASRGDQLIRDDLCEQAIRLARALAGLLPDEPEVSGLLALLLLTDARRAARLDPSGGLVLLADQDRGRWDRAMIAEGEALTERALRQGRPGPYQLHAAIAACHSVAPSAAATDWRQIALLYGELLRHEPTPVVEANRAVAVAMAEGPAAGLAILDTLSQDPRLARWPQLPIARAELLRRLGRTAEAATAYRAALNLEPPTPERAFIAARLGTLPPPDPGRGPIPWAVRPTAQPAEVAGGLRQWRAGAGGWQGGPVTGIRIREAGPADLCAIAKVAVAAGQDEEWSGSDPAYLRHLLAHGRVVVAGHGAEVTGFGAIRQLGTGPAAVQMLCDLFVDPRSHGRGLGRAMLAELWQGDAPRMTFSSQHAHALPLYTRFGLDAWWPLLYLAGPVAALARPAGWEVAGSTPGQVSDLEREWTGTDRAADHAAWAARPAGQPVLARLHGQPLAAGTVAGEGAEYGLVHLALAPAAGTAGAGPAVLAVLAALEPPAGGPARVCLPAPHPAVRPLLAAGWRCGYQDLFMATDPGLLDPRRAVPSPALA
jgi:RNA polymerase sigma-70 factor (ECF subfamily)